MVKYILITLLLIVALPITAIYANQSEHEETLNQMANNEIRNIISKDFILNELKKQNLEHEDYSMAELKALDTKWIAEKHKSKRAIVDKVMDNKIAEYLNKIKKDSDGLYTQITIVDNKGLAIAQTDLTQHYWHGREKYWKNTTLGGGGKPVHTSGVEFNDNTQVFQAEISVAIISGEENLGLVMVGVDVEKLIEDK